MLSLTYQPTTYRQADNLLPLPEGRYETRPGFFQVLKDPVIMAVGWGDAVVYSPGKNDISPLNGLWLGGYHQEILSLPESALIGTLFQSLTSLGNRENRLYLSDGQTLYYLHRQQQPGGEVTGVTLEPETLTLLVGSKETLTATTIPEWALNQTLSWSSADEAIARVNEDGRVTAVAQGETIITVETIEGNYNASSAVTVTPFIPVESVTLEPDTAELELPRTLTQQFTATVLPDDATNTNVLWRSYDEAIATVDEYGLVTGIAEGETHIVVMTENGGLTAISPLTVTKFVEVTGIVVTPETLALTEKATGQLTAKVEPEDASNKTFSWSSADDGIATVSSTGLVTGVAAGTVLITAVTEEGLFADRCTVVVT